MIMRPLEPTPCISSSCISSSRISPRGSRGTTMLEVLISLLIVCFGLLGAAGMQAFGIKASLSVPQKTNTGRTHFINWTLPYSLYTQH